MSKDTGRVAQIGFTQKPVLFEGSGEPAEK
jgi:hypothetical protein